MKIMQCWEVAWAILCPLLCMMPRRVNLSPLLPSHLKPQDPDINNVESRLHTGRHQPGIHPMPSDNLPVNPPILGSSYSMPTEEDLNPRKLQRLLGNEYDPVFMSSVRPIESMINPNGTYLYNLKNGHPASEMPRDLKKLAFSLPGSRRKYRIKNRKTRKFLRNYLWTYTYCPVNYRWRNLGERFWPQWIREGDCENGRSCSIPPGMNCKPKESTTKTILWWHCRRKSCYWIPIKYPIIVQCSCSC